MFVFAFFVMCGIVILVGAVVVIVSMRHHIHLAHQQKQVTGQLPEGKLNE